MIFKPHPLTPEEVNENNPTLWNPFVVSPIREHYKTDLKIVSCVKDNKFMVLTEADKVTIYHDAQEKLSYYGSKKIVAETFYNFITSQGKTTNEIYTLGKRDTNGNYNTDKDLKCPTGEGTSLPVIIHTGEVSWDLIHQD